MSREGTAVDTACDGVPLEGQPGADTNSSPPEIPPPSKKPPPGPPPSTLPLVLPPTFPARTTVLVQLDDTAMDLSGDVGAIGRLHVDDASRVLLDLKGEQYVGHVVPCNSYLVVSMGATEAKVDCLVNDVCHATRQRNVLDTMHGVVTAGAWEEDGVPSTRAAAQKKPKRAATKMAVATPSK